MYCLTQGEVSITYNDSHIDCLIWCLHFLTYLSNMFYTWISSKNNKYWDNKIIPHLLFYNYINFTNIFCLAKQRKIFNLKWKFKCIRVHKLMDDCSIYYSRAACFKGMDLHVWYQPTVCYSHPKWGQYTVSILITSDICV